jgi:hypothetical protein
MELPVEELAVAIVKLLFYNELIDSAWTSKSRVGLE